MAVKQTIIPGEDGKQTDSSKLKDIRTQIPFQEVSNMTTQRSAGNQEFSLWSKKEPPDQRENQRRKMFKKMMFQTTTSNTKSREMEHMRNQTSNTATAQFHDREGRKMNK